MDRYRSVLEVLKFGDIQSTLKGSQVSSIWHRCCKSEELFAQLFLNVGFHPNLIKALISPKSMLKTYLRVKTYSFHIDKDQLTVYSPSQERLIERNTFISDQRPATDASFAVLPDGNLLCCGGNECGVASNRAFIVREFRTISQIRDLNIGRERAGCIFHSDSVYLFGGSDVASYLRSSEAISVLPWPLRPNRPWRQLPNMKFPHYSFSPCAYRESIYLISSQCIGELFNCLTETFSSLTTFFNTVNSNPIAVIQGKELIVLHHKKVSVVNIDTMEVVTEQELTFSRPDVSIYYHQGRVISVGRKVYIVYFAAKGVGIWNLDNSTYQYEEMTLAIHKF